MAFIKGTQIFTSSGWKNIEDISGHDKVLNRNFLGDAQFTQPFALKKSKYNGNLTKIGGKNWNIITTPDHDIVYQHGYDLIKEKAANVKVNRKNRILRQFRYTPPEDYRQEYVSIYNVFGQRSTTVSNEDWFVLLGYTICRAKVEVAKHGRLALQLRIDNDKSEQEIKTLSDILDRIGVQWSLLQVNDKQLIRISSKNTLPSRLVYHLRSRKRKDMYLSDKIIYNTPKELARTLIEAIISASKKAETVVSGEYQLVTSNEKLVDSLVLLGTLSCYGMAKKLLFAEGTDTGMTVATQNVYSLAIRQPVKSYSVTQIDNLDYDGDVYEIDLFDGQIYTRNDGMPVWVNPK